MKSFKGFDLNLLVTFTLLYRERSVKNAAKRLGVNPSTVSKSLAKLRSFYSNDLFIQASNELVPTHLSEQIIEEVEELISLATTLSEAPACNDWNGQKINLLLESQFLYCSLNNISTDLHYIMDAKNLDIRVGKWEYDSMSEIIHGKADVGICGLEASSRSRYHPDKLPDNICHQVLFSDIPAVYLHKTHSVLDETWNIESFIKCEHIGIEWEKHKRWALDDCLATLGYERKITLVVEDFMHAITLAANPKEHRITIAPSYCFQYIKKIYPNIIKIDIPLSIEMISHIEVLYVILYHKRERRSNKNKIIRDYLINRIAN